MQVSIRIAQEPEGRVFDMYQHIALIGLLATVSYLLLANATDIRQKQLEDGKNLIVKVVTPEEMNRILEQNPNAVELKATRSAEIKGRFQRPQGRSIITYTLGNGREAGDSLVSSDSSTNDYDVPTTLTVTMKYPSSGVGAIITFVKINTYQNNSEGRAYATSGGIGQRNIVVTIEAYRTTYFDFYSWVYGK